MENPQTASLATSNSSNLGKDFSTVEQQDAWLLSLITLGDLLKPGSPVLNDSALELLLSLYTETLLEVGKEAFEKAFREVMKETTFRPDIALIRRAAGVNRGIVDPVEVEAKAALVFMIEAMRKHGRTLGTIRGRDGAPDTPPPVVPRLIRATVRAFGGGSMAEGLESLDGHPWLDQMRRGRTNYEGGDPNFREKAIRDFEKRWVETYAAVAREERS